MFEVILNFQINKLSSEILNIRQNRDETFQVSFLLNWQTYNNLNTEKAYL